MYVIASYLGSQIIFQNFNTLCGHMIKYLLTELVRVELGQNVRTGPRVKY